MGKSQKLLKRKLNNKKWFEEQSKEVEATQDSNEEDLLQNVVQEEDSSDSEPEVEESDSEQDDTEEEDNEDNEFVEEQSEENNDNVSDDDSEEGNTKLIINLKEESDGESDDSHISEKDETSENSIEETQSNKIHNQLKKATTKEDEEDNQESIYFSKGSKNNQEGGKTKSTGKGLPSRKKGDTSSKINSKTEEANQTSKYDEYEDYDTSDEEDIRNTVGNIPKNWYDDYKHLGYDWDGQQLIKPETGDHLDQFLKRMEDPDFWRTVKDPQTGQNVILSDEDINLIKRIGAQKIPDVSFDEYAPWVEWFTSQVEQLPIRKFPEHKRSFLPSKSEAKKVSKLVHALKMGWIKTREEQAKLRAKKEPQFYMLWSTDDQAEEMRRIHKHIPAPKRLLPGHAESYNPPSEYLFDAKEMKEWNKLKNAPWKRKLHFVPEKYESLRKVPSYPRYIKERFLRCLDLYLCPRAIKMKLNIEADSLVPKLPSPRDLQPFPTTLAIEYKGHTDMVRSISTDKTGQYLLSGSDDCTIKIWEVNTGRCLKTIQTDSTVRCVEWCPNAALSLVLVATGNEVLLINPGVGDFLVGSRTDTVLKEVPRSDVVVNERVKAAVQWCEPEEKLYEKGVRIQLKHFKMVTQVTWHGKGDYFGSVMPDGQSRSVLVSQISKRKSQLPFSKSKGLVQCILFHPTKPFLFVATERHVRIYNLLKQAQIKKLMTNSNGISTMAIHPGGDNLLVGTYDRKMLWFDLDLSRKPYQTLRLHGTSVRGVAYHKRYPLFASGSDDRNVIISHGMVYNDLLQDPLIVPLKKLQDHQAFNDFGVLDVHFHPFQPWVFSAGADSTIKLYSN